MNHCSRIDTKRFDYTTTIGSIAGCISATAVQYANRIEKQKDRRVAEVNTRFFKALMSDKGISMRELAKLMGMNHSQLSLTISAGTRRLQLDEAAQLSQIFGVSLHRIVENAGVSVAPVAGRRVSVIGAVQGDGTLLPTPSDVVERTFAPEDLAGEVVAIQFRTGATSLDWMDGWVSFARPLSGIDPGALGRLCLVKLRGGPTAIATVKRGYVDGTYNLTGPFSRESVHLDGATPLLMTRH